MNRAQPISPQYVNPIAGAFQGVSPAAKAGTYFVVDNVGVKLSDEHHEGAALIHDHERAYKCSIAAKIMVIVAVVAFVIMSGTAHTYDTLFSYRANSSQKFDPEVQTFAAGYLTVQQLNLTYAAYGFQPSELFMPAVCMSLLDPEGAATGLNVSSKALISFLHQQSGAAWVLPDLSLYSNSLRIGFGLVAGAVIEMGLAVIAWREFKKTKYLIRNSVDLKMVAGIAIGFGVTALVGASLVMIVINLPLPAYYWQPANSGSLTSLCKLTSATSSVSNVQLLNIEGLAVAMAGVTAGAFLFTIGNGLLMLRHESNLGAWKRDIMLGLGVMDKLSMKLCCCRKMVSQKDKILPR